MIGRGPGPEPGGLHYRFLLKSFIPFGFLLLSLQALAQVLRRGAACAGAERDDDRKPG